MDAQRKSKFQSSGPSPKKLMTFQRYRTFFYRARTIRSEDVKPVRIDLEPKDKKKKDADAGRTCSVKTSVAFYMSDRKRFCD